MYVKEAIDIYSYEEEDTAGQSKFLLRMWLSSSLPSYPPSPGHINLAMAPVAADKAEVRGVSSLFTCTLPIAQALPFTALESRATAELGILTGANSPRVMDHCSRSRG